jgi:hypothetical protein
VRSTSMSSPVPAVGAGCAGPPLVMTGPPFFLMEGPGPGVGAGGAVCGDGGGTGGGALGGASHPASIHRTRKARTTAARPHELVVLCRRSSRHRPRAPNAKRSQKPTTTLTVGGDSGMPAFPKPTAVTTESSRAIITGRATPAMPGQSRARYASLEGVTPDTSPTTPEMGRSSAPVWREAHHRDSRPVKVDDIGPSGGAVELKYLLKLDRPCFDGQPDRAVRIKGGANDQAQRREGSAAVSDVGAASPDRVGVRVGTRASGRGSGT